MRRQAGRSPRYVVPCPGTPDPLNTMRARDSDLISLRIRFADHVRLGPGKFELLAQIEQSGSIEQAAAVMNMSYRRALMLIESINAACNEPAVIIEDARSGPTRSSLTPLGEALLRAYEASLQETRDAVDRHFAQLLPRFRDLP